MVVLALKTGLALLGMFAITNQGHNDIRTVGCDKQAESLVANWTLICGMHRASILIFCTLAVTSYASTLLIFATLRNIYSAGGG
ncbi:hypothetical protein GJ744_005973 [Endocarpon pusillum]|uniref:Uncharacterized protein n=1 Tax=Endocarpon pusillum TaxID=364733 RepID=A0A8H7ABU6_9EURO|nr:hypothetical protein GJ744_005973 [Endocarpon pusillum]